MKICIICHKQFEGRGNNVQPAGYGLKEGVGKRKACDACNTLAVIPVRLEVLCLRQKGTTITPSMVLDKMRNREMFVGKQEYSAGC